MSVNLNMMNVLSYVLNQCQTERNRKLNMNVWHSLALAKPFFFFFFAHFI